MPTVTVEYFEQPRSSGEETVQVNRVVAVQIDPNVAGLSTAVQGIHFRMVDVANNVLGAQPMPSPRDL